MLPHFAGGKREVVGVVVGERGWGPNSPSCSKRRFSNTLPIPRQYRSVENRISTTSRPQVNRCLGDSALNALAGLRETRRRRTLTVHSVSVFGLRNKSGEWEVAPHGSLFSPMLVGPGCSRTVQDRKTVGARGHPSCSPGFAAQSRIAYGGGGTRNVVSASTCPSR